MAVKVKRRRPSNNGRRPVNNGRKRTPAASVQSIPSTRKIKKSSKKPLFPKPVGYELPPRATKQLTKALMLRCIVGSGGIIARIAAAAGTSYMQVYKWIRKREKTDKEVKAAMLQETSRMGDNAEITILDAMMQRLDISTASRTAQWYLAQQAQDRGYRSKKTLVHEGGDKPIGLDTTQHVALEDLDLDLPTRKVLLKALRTRKKGGAK